MRISDLVPFLLLAVPVMSLAGIAMSATAATTSHRWVYGVLGWIGWLATVGVGVFIGLVAVALSCWGNTSDDCGEGAAGLVLVGGLVAAILPGLLAYGLTRPRRTRQ